VIDRGRHSVLGVLVDAVDYEAAVERIVCAARDRRPFAATALAVHGVMTGAADPMHRYRLNHLDLVTADGQPVRWALDRLHGTALPDRCYGPMLARRLLERAASDGIPVYFYGSRAEVLARVRGRLAEAVPSLVIAGSSPSRFCPVQPDDLAAIAAEIRASGAGLVFIGLGCPRQEAFAFHIREHLDVPVVAVGAAFDYLAGMLREPPEWVQRRGLQWAWRLREEPRRLWRRYLVLNPAYLGLLALQRLRVWRPDDVGAPPPAALMVDA
jgi:exopolysaccharide biosynthesis WecB/TagA/CpsF family protein